MLAGVKSCCSVKDLSEMGMQSQEQGKANLPQVCWGERMVWYRDTWPWVSCSA